MSRVIILKGLPASGKTTYAKELVENSAYVRINKDDIRAMMHNSKFSKPNEKLVLQARDGMIFECLYEGKNVVVDDTNFEPKHEERIREIADKLKAKVEVKFFDTPLEECIKRNNARQNPVPTSVIMTMYNKYIKKNIQVEYDDNLDECIIVDVDGTLAHMCDRNVYDASKAMDDTLDDAVGNIVSMAYGHGYKVIILTGRKRMHLQVTKDWLEKNGIKYDDIYCREDEDNRHDTEFKQELYENNIKGKYNVKYILDDRPSVCRMWRSLGLKVLQVGDPYVEF